ncbi:hypothetical protein ABT324_10670 [Saccharopolyspora sp. NPDC000359]
MVALPPLLGDQLDSVIRLAALRAADIGLAEAQRALGGALPLA